MLFVCLGNICRSPTAHAVFQAIADDRGLAQQVSVDSAGTGDWHLGHAPDRRTSAVASQRGYDMDQLRARLVEAGFANARRFTRERVVALYGALYRDLAEAAGPAAAYGRRSPPHPPPREAR